MEKKMYMKMIKKSITLVLSILLIVLIIPFKSVYADPDPVVANPMLVINYLDSEGNSQKYQYTKNILPPDTEEGNLPTGLSVGYIDDKFVITVSGEAERGSDPDVILKVKFNGQGSGAKQFISSNRTILIKGTGWLRLSALPNEIAEQVVEDAEYAYIRSDENIIIGDDTTSNLKVSLEPGDFPSGSNIYKHHYGMVAKSFIFKNSETEITSRETALLSTFSNTGDNNDRVLLDNANVSFGYNKICDNDTEDRKADFFAFNDSTNCSGNITIKNNSVLNIKYDTPPTSDDDHFYTARYSIDLPRESSFTVNNSKLEFHTKTNIAFLKAGSFTVENCRDTFGQTGRRNYAARCQNISSKNGGVMRVDSFKIINSDFAMSTAVGTPIGPYPREIVNPEDQPLVPTFSAPLGAATQPTTEIIINEGAVPAGGTPYNVELTVGDNASNNYLFSGERAVNGEGDPASQEIGNFDHIKISLAGTTSTVGVRLANTGADIENYIAPQFSVNDGSNLVFEYQRASDDVSKISKWKDLRIIDSTIVPVPEPTPTPGGGSGSGGNTGGGSGGSHSSHAVPNTSVTK